MKTGWTVPAGVLLFCCVICSAQQDFFDLMAGGRVVSGDKIIWTQEGPGNGGMSDLVRYHPNVPDTVFHGPDMGANYQSDDNGVSWYDVRDYDAGAGFGRLRDVNYSPSNSDRAIAIEFSQLRESSDRGKSWSLVLNCPWYASSSDGSDGTSWISKVSAIAIDPNHSETWYVGAGKHTRGQFWPSDSLMKDATAANPHGPSHDPSGKIWKTTNGGESWTELSTGLDAAAQFCRIIVNPNNSNQVFAASNVGIYRSDNGGSSWSNLGGALPNNTIIDMDSYFSGGTFTLYVLDQVRYYPSGSTTTNTGGVFKSTDLGASWQDITGNLYLDLNQLQWSVYNAYYDYIADWFEISKSAAQSTYSTKPSDALQPVQQIRADPIDPDTVYIGLNDPQGEHASFGPGPLWKTSNGGSSWMMITRGHGPAFAEDASFWIPRGNPINENMTFGHEPLNQQWGDSYPQRTMRNFDVNSRGDIMLISGHNTLVSTNRGATFEQVDEDYTENGNLVGRGNSDLPGETLKQDARLRPGELYLGSGEHRLWKTTLDDIKGRAAMKQLPTMDTVTAIAIHPSDTNTVFVTSNRQYAMGEIWRSTDGGETFSKWGDTTGATSSMRTKALTIDPVNPQYMYFGVTDRSSSDWGSPGGFYFSSDGGQNWTTRNTGLPANPRVNDMVFDPRDPSGQSLFLAAQKRTFQVPAANEGGLYHTSDRGQTWTKINVDTEVDGVNELKLDSTGRLWLTSGHRTSSVGGLWFSDDYGSSWTQSFVSPSTDSVDVSLFNSNLVVVSVSELNGNPGIYLSEDRGMTWSKNNRIISINNRISEVEFSVHDPEVLWLSCVGAGFFKGTYSPYQPVEFTSAQDIGNVAAAGSFEPIGGTILLTGSGNDIWGTADEFHFASQTQTGDCEVIARVMDIENVNYWSKAGVMIRNSLSADAANVSVVVIPSGRVSMQWRTAAGESTGYSGLVGDASGIKWVRLIRSGDRFSGYYSTDGIHWTLIDTRTVSMSSNAEVGLGVTSHSDGDLCSATFTEVSLRSLPVAVLAGRVAGRELVLSWDGSRYSTNTLLECDDLRQGAWTVVSNYTEIDDVISVTNLTDSTGRFYKIQGEY